VDSRKGASDDFDALIQRVDEMCREAERTGSYARQSLSRKPFYPDRRRNPRFADGSSGSDGDQNDAA
jgi:hypothetical protein